MSARCPGGPGRHRDHDIAAVHDVDRFLPADLAHRPRVRRVRGVAQRHLRDDRSRIDQPRDHPDIRPALRRVVEDVVELGLAGQQVVEHRLARFAQVLRHPVQQLRVPDLVLDLGRQGELAAERRRPHQPLALGEDAHELGVGVHLHETQDRGPVFVGHGVRGFHRPARREVRLEALEPGFIGLVVGAGRRLCRGRQGRRSVAGGKHRVERERVGHGSSSNGAPSLRQPGRASKRPYSPVKRGARFSRKAASPSA